MATTCRFPLFKRTKRFRRVLLALRNLLAKIDQSLAQRGIGRSGLVSSLCRTWSDLAAVWSARQVLTKMPGTLIAL
jgi:hypothetical protein